VDNVNSKDDPIAARQCSCGASASNNRIAKRSAAGGVLSALGMCAACCLLPFGLLSVGIAGAWVSKLDALAPYKWAFISLTAALLGYGFYAVNFRSPRR
jgi:mercuric ion transport protein